jgi:hypothetical protein
MKSAVIVAADMGTGDRYKKGFPDTRLRSRAL